MTSFSSLNVESLRRETHRNYLIRVYCEANALKATPVGEIGGNMLQKQFFQMLPTDFTKQDAIEQAKVLGVALSTMERWITKSVQTASIKRLATGVYQKDPSCIA